MRADEIPTLVAVRALARSGRARQLRESAGLSLQEIADVVGVTQASISRWELGQRKPRGEAAVRYGRLLQTLANLPEMREPGSGRAQGSREDERDEVYAT